jgi:hypothetical protein
MAARDKCPWSKLLQLFWGDNNQIRDKAGDVGISYGCLTVLFMTKEAWFRALVAAWSYNYVKCMCSCTYLYCLDSCDSSKLLQFLNDSILFYVFIQIQE